jgi:uncharacterized membrane protein
MKRNFTTGLLLIIGIISGGFARVAFAQSSGTGFGSFRDLINTIGGLITKYVIPLLVAMAILYFLWNIVHFISNMGNEKEREAFKKYSINGIIALFILLSVWGIIGIFSTALFNKAPGIPQFPTSSGPNATGTP